MKSALIYSLVAMMLTWAQVAFAQSTGTIDCDSAGLDPARDPAASRGKFGQD